MKGFPRISIAPLLGMPLVVLSCSSNSPSSSDGGGSGGAASSSGGGTGGSGGGTSGSGGGTGSSGGGTGSSSGGTGSSGGGGSSGGDACTALTGYMPTTTTPLSFATDIYPMLSDATSCGTGGSCHGSPPMFLDKAMTKTLPFTTPPAMVLASLMGSSFNDPSMKLVVPKNVGSSFLAYKISGATALACVRSNCTAGKSVGVTTACGDAMPPPGYTAVTSANRTKILDWIAQGAAN